MNSIDVSSLISKLDKIEEISLERPLSKAAILVENAAKLNVPVDTGWLRNSITHEVEGNIAEIGTNTEYAPYVEFGTGLFAANGDGRQTPWSYQDAKGEWHTTTGQLPQPYLGPALTDNAEQVELLIVEGVKEELANL